jgi:hypothetical protein
MAPTIVVLYGAISVNYHWFQLVEWFGHNCSLSQIPTGCIFGVLLSIITGYIDLCITDKYD